MSSTGIASTVCKMNIYRYLVDYHSKHGESSGGSKKYICYFELTTKTSFFFSFFFGGYYLFIYSWINGRHCYCPTLSQSIDFPKLDWTGYCCTRDVEIFCFCSHLLLNMLTKQNHWNISNVYNVIHSIRSKKGGKNINWTWSCALKIIQQVDSFVIKLHFWFSSFAWRAKNYFMLEMKNSNNKHHALGIIAIANGVVANVHSITVYGFCAYFHRNSKMTTANVLKAQPFW